MTVYLLQPVDTQFYRSSLPFDAGTDGYADSDPFPRPRTVYGAFRALGLARKKVSLDLRDAGEDFPFDPVWGDRRGPGDLFLRGPFLYRKSAHGSFWLLLSPPADLVVEKKGAEPKVHHCLPLEKKDLASCSDLPSSAGLFPAGFPEGKTVMAKAAADCLLPSGDLPRASNLAGYLCGRLTGKTKTAVLFSREEALILESRVGVMRESGTHRAEEGMLYATRHCRFKGCPGGEEWGFWVELSRKDGSAPPLDEDGVLKLGGEGRCAAFRAAGSDESLGIDWTGSLREAVAEAVAASGGRFKLYLLTPGLFGGAFHPFEEDEKGAFLDTGAGRARLVSVALAGRVPVGGWDIQKRFPKPLEDAAPEGTVYFLRLEEWPEDAAEGRRRAEAVFDEYNFRSLCSGACEKEGFGLTLVGGWHV